MAKVSYELTAEEIASAMEEPLLIHCMSAEAIVGTIAALRHLLRMAKPFVRCDVTPCECGRDRLHAKIEEALL